MNESLTFLFIPFRIYADVIHVKNSFISLKKTDTGPKFGFDRDLNSMISFLRSFYDEAKILPEKVEYVEGISTGRYILSTIWAITALNFTPAGGPFFNLTFNVQCIYLGT